MVFGKFYHWFSQALPFGIYWRRSNTCKTNGVPNLLHIEIKKSKNFHTREINWTQ